MEYATEDDDEKHLNRSREVWDRHSESYDRDERDLAAQRERAIDALGLVSGDQVLEVGCGPGTNFERVLSEITEEGSVLGVDYSPAMVERARERVRDAGWDNVTIREADASTVEFDETFDAALAILAMSVMPEKRRAVETVYESLRPGGSLVVFDVRPVPSGVGRIFNPLLRRFFCWYANYNPEGDVADSIRDVFDETETIETYVGGVGYSILAHKYDSD